MANTTTTPNMGLPNPVPGVETGPQYALDIQSCFNFLDQHNHSPPNGGVQINPSGININSSLAFNNQLATGMKAVIFTDQLSLSTLNALYTINGDLWYNDATNPIQITSGGSVLATSSGISDGSGNSAAFSTGVLVVQNSSTAPDSIQCGSILMGNTGTASSGFVTISPVSLTTSYALTLPTIPAATSFLTIDTSGNIAGSVPFALGQQISASSGSSQVISASSYTAITNLSVTITTRGRPVMVMLQEDGSNNQIGGFQIQGSGGNYEAEVAFSKNSGSTFIGGAICGFTVTANLGTGIVFVPGSTFLFIDPVSSGTYTYVAYAKVLTALSITPSNVVLVAFEL